MFYPKNHEQTIIQNPEGDSISVAADAFLIDRQAGKLSKYTIKFYRDYLTSFTKYAQAHSASGIDHIDADLIRCYILMFSENHNPGGVHAAYRSIRAFLRWVEKEEMMPDDWKNPMKILEPPKGT